MGALLVKLSVALAAPDTRGLKVIVNEARGLGRAVDRLERLQRRRRGEPVLPPVHVRLER